MKTLYRLQRHSAMKDPQGEQTRAVQIKTLSMEKNMWSEDKQTTSSKLFTEREEPPNIIPVDNDS